MVTVSVKTLSQSITERKVVFLSIINIICEITRNFRRAQLRFLPRLQRIGNLLRCGLMPGVKTPLSVGRDNAIHFRVPAFLFSIHF